MSKNELAEQLEQLERIKRGCTPYQYGVLCKVVAAVNAVLIRERATLAYFADDGNDGFFGTVKRALLDGMANAREPQPPTEHTDPVQGEPSEEYRPTYWWNND